jgi:hypothetical protein
VTNRPGVPDHAAPATGIWANLPFRTAVQGLGTDVGIAMLFVIYDGLNNSDVDYRLLFITVIKTGVMTGLSYVMKKVKPPIPSS